MEIGYIYKIVNKINGKIYIGQTVNPYRRWYDHRYEGKQDKHRYQSHLYNAMKKYGVDNFYFEIIEECDKDIIDERERFWILELNTLSPNGYNIAIGGKKLFGEYNPFYGKTHTKETKKILSEKHKGIYDGENNPMYGKHHTDETKEKIKQKNIEKGMYEYHSNRMMNNRTWENSINVNPIIAINHDNKKILLFYTIANAGRYIKSIGLSNAKSPNAMRECLNNKDYSKRTAYQHEWIYAVDLIKNNFMYKSFSTHGPIQYLTNNNKDKIELLFKPYFYDNKDEIIDLSDYYDDISNRFLSVKNIYSNYLNNYFSEFLTVREN